MAKQSKTDRIRKMLNDDVAPADIAKKVKVSKSYVYNMRSKMHKQERVDERMERAKMRVNLLPVDDSVSQETNDPLDLQMGGNHYKDMEIQPIQFIVANNLGFLEGCIVKRVSRWRRIAGGIEDLEKIKHEVDLLIAADQGRI